MRERQSSAKRNQISANTQSKNQMSNVRSSAPQFTQEPVLSQIESGNDKQPLTVKTMSFKGENCEVIRQKPNVSL